ncbi:MAG: arsenite methyltransferase [Promethearchaeota archaeon]
MAKTKKVSEMSSEEIKEAVRQNYERVAQPSGGSCCPPSSTEEKKTDVTTASCCGSEATPSDPRTSYAELLGYDVKGMPESATESFAGCGNPVAVASLQEGEVVLDLGSGAGLDMFHAAKRVGNTGRVIGVDMTPAMIEKAKYGADQLGLENVEFRLGDIEDLPVEDEFVDVIISNCVINLAPDKAKVFREAFRVLRPGGRVMVSDIVLETELPEEMRQNISYYAGCIGGAILEEEYLQHIRDAGFENVEVMEKTGGGPAVSAKIAAYKPK